MSDLSDIQALLTGRKVYDSTTQQWRVYDANSNELADEGGVLWRGNHGWLLRIANESRVVEWLTRARRRSRR